MFYKCTNSIAKGINERLEKKDIIESFTSGDCCPDGSKNINGVCSPVCVNCNYNECSTGSQNRGVLYDYPSDNKQKKNLEEDEGIFNYIVIDIEN